MSHRIILNKTSSPTTLDALSTPDAVEFNFSYAANHDLTPAQAGEQFAKIQKHLDKAVEIANGTAVE